MAKDLGHYDHSKRLEELGRTDGVRRPLKVVFLGAGSGFLRGLFPDILSIPGAGAAGELALVDVDAERLGLAEKLCGKIVGDLGAGWTISADTDRRNVLGGADYVINCIEVSGTACVRFDNDIPAKFGVDQCIGDTIGPGGLFKALRTVPVWLDVLEDVEAFCPDAWVLNYTNPMSILCLSAAMTSEANVVGLCHSVQGASRAMAAWADVPYSELTWQCAGVNHLAWFTEYSHKGVDLYPQLKDRAANDPEFAEQDLVRLDLMNHFGYYLTESSGHDSEYVPYYRKRKDLIETYCRDAYRGGSSFYADHWPQWRVNSDEARRAAIASDEPITHQRTIEYAGNIIEAIETNTPSVIYGTMPNDGLIDNLPASGVVEVACLADGRGVTPTHYGSLPPQCAALCASNMSMYELAAIACVEKSKEAAVHSLLLDPLTAAVCSPAEIKQMTLELFDAEKDFLPGYN